jgi:hypothetical protein
VCPDCYANATAAGGGAEGDGGDFAACCGRKAALLVWNNLTLLGVGACVAVLALAWNAAASCFLWRRVRRERRYGYGGWGESGRDRPEGLPMHEARGGAAVARAERARAARRYADEDDDL